MNAFDACLFLVALVAGLSVFFVIAAFISDYAWPWLATQWHARPARPQATYKSKSA